MNKNPSFSAAVPVQERNTGEALASGGKICYTVFSDKIHEKGSAS
jgi:hypothetical protein